MSDTTWIGQEVARLRVLAGLTQQDLADAAGITQAHIANIEAGRRPADKLSTLLDIAARLRVPLTDLIGQPAPVTTHDDLFPRAAVASIRAALDDADEPPRLTRSAPELRQVTAALMAARMNCDHPALSAGLGPLIAETRAGYDATGSRQSARFLVRALFTAALTLKPLGWVDLAMRCATQAREVAAVLGDADAYGAAEFAVAQCTLTAGNRRRSYELAAGAATRLTAPAGTDAERAWRGLLHLHAAYTAASLGAAGDVDAHHAEAEALAGRVHGDPWWMEFTVANARTWRVGAELELGRADRVPALALLVDAHRLRTPQRAGRFHADAGRGHFLAGNPAEAVRSLHRAYHAAPTELRTRPSVMEIIRQMYRDATPRPGTDLRELARLVGVA